MKKLIVLCSLIIGLTNCNSFKANRIEKEHSEIIAIVADVTNKRLIWPSATATLSMFRCDEQPDEACTFILTAISNKQINPVFSCILPDATTTEKRNYNDDAQFRKKCILTFYHQIGNAYRNFYSMFDTTQTLDHSEVFATLSSTLHELVADSSDEKILVMYSDLLEKSSYGNAYTNFTRLPVSTIAERFNATGLLPNSLKGITVVVVYNTTGRADDARFIRMYSAYKLLLEQRGAIVKEQANNDADGY